LDARRSDRRKWNMNPKVPLRRLILAGQSRLGLQREGNTNEGDLWRGGKRIE